MLGRASVVASLSRRNTGGHQGWSLVAGSLCLIRSRKTINISIKDEQSGRVEIIVDASSRPQWCMMAPSHVSEDGSAKHECGLPGLRCPSAHLCCTLQRRTNTLFHFDIRSNCVCAQHPTPQHEHRVQLIPSLSRHHHARSPLLPSSSIQIKSSLRAEDFQLSTQASDETWQSQHGSIASLAHSPTRTLLLRYKSNHKSCRRASLIPHISPIGPSNPFLPV